VLIVDDHRGVLDSVSAMLARDFEVAGVAIDGPQALEVAQRVNPHLIVLDINMPGLDGFQTFRALEQQGSRAAVVFLSVFDVEEHVSEAFRCGGHGYVLKSRAARDLPTALRQAHLGRRFAPSLGTMAMLTHGRGHDVQVHAGGESLLDDLAAFFDLALQRGDATCVISTAHVRDGLSARLRRRGWPIGGSDRHKRYLTIDAAAGLSRFMRNGLPDRNLLAAIAAGLEDYRRAGVERETNRLTIFGNMSELLVADGNTSGALALERLWHTLTADRPFYTICGFCRSAFEETAAELRPGLYAEHEVVSHASGV